MTCCCHCFCCFSCYYKTTNTITPPHHNPPLQPHRHHIRTTPPLLPVPHINTTPVTSSLPPTLDQHHNCHHGIPSSYHTSITSPPSHTINTPVSKSCLHHILENMLES
jgi:hypothetical protein